MFWRKRRPPPRRSVTLEKIILGYDLMIEAVENLLEQFATRGISPEQYDLKDHKQLLEARRQELLASSEADWQQLLEEARQVDRDIKLSERILKTRRDDRSFGFDFLDSALTVQMKIISGEYRVDD